MCGGCAAHLRYHDAEHSDYHRFGPSERYYYQRWATANTHQHESIQDLSEKDQKAYWNWRHAQK